jgi:mannose-6-phosphate isomerase-like protein (cupin superfamily)
MQGSSLQHEPEISGKIWFVRSDEAIASCNHVLIIQDKSLNINLMLDNTHTREIRIIGQVKEMKKGFAANLEEETTKNTDFRRVLYTGKFSQLVLMCLRPMEDIGEETHDDVDQFFRFEEGEGVVVIDGVKNVVKDGSGVIVPSGAKHNVVNTSKTKNLKLYTIYSPPEHQDKVVRKTKQEALAREEHYNGKPTEK